ncbi:MAG: hypothetical protein K0R26_805, partial [Bacteroidota bacterium]|nr:hypothetical protein [Bacteroidota bacterium]
MKTINLFNSEKQNLTRQSVEGQKQLPEKYCPNCGMKHQVKSELVHVEGFPKDC